MEGCLGRSLFREWVFFDFVSIDILPFYHTSLQDIGDALIILMNVIFRMVHLYF